MKYLIIIVTILFSCSKGDVATKSVAINKNEIKIAKALIQGAFDDLWGGVDSTKIKNYHTDDFIILEQGEIWDNSRIKKYMRKQLAKTNRSKRVNKMEYIAIDKYGESMQIAYYNFAAFYSNDSLIGKAKWLESALAVRTKEGWRLKMMHSTRVRK